MIYRYAIVDATSHVVVNVTEVETGVEYHPGENLLLIQSDTANIGDTRNSDGTFTPPALPVPPVPESTTNAQMRCALIDSDPTMFAQIDGAANAAGTTSELYQRWNYANYFGRRDAFVLMLQSSFGKTDAEIDALFTLAATK